MRHFRTERQLIHFLFLLACGLCAQSPLPTRTVSGEIVWEDKNAPVGYNLIVELHDLRESFQVEHAMVKIDGSFEFHGVEPG
jgi:hypothetical protein